MLHLLRIAILAVLLVATLPQAARALLSEGQFTQAFLHALTAQAPELTPRRVEPLRLEMEDTAGREFTAFLDNAYSRYRQNPATLDETIALYAAGLIETWKADDSVDRGRIVPVVKDAAFVPDLRASMRQRGEDPDWEPAVERYNAALVILYAEDTALSIHYLTEDALTEAGFAREGRRERAQENLKALLPKVQVFPDDGFYWVTAGGDYDASLLLFARLWEELTLPIDGELVAAIPARNALMITGSEDAAGLSALKRMVTEVMATDSYALTDELFVFRDGTFMLYAP